MNFVIQSCLVEVATLSPDNVIECVVHDVFDRPYVLSEHTLILPRFYPTWSSRTRPSIRGSGVKATVQEGVGKL